MAVTLHVDPAAVTAGAAGLTRAADTLAEGGSTLATAGALDLGELSPVHVAAVDRLRGAFDVGDAVATELYDDVVGCLADYAASDQTSAGSFTALTPPTGGEH